MRVPTVSKIAYRKGVASSGLSASAHETFLAAQQRSYMRLREKEHETTCYGIVLIAGEFKDMDATSENHPSFYLLNLSGRVLFKSNSNELFSFAFPLRAPEPDHLQKLSGSCSCRGAGRNVRTQLSSSTALESRK
uniref:Uncharacterized protein n=1 Tax=Fundulus heteroclitus TaxID=8078 RepID=A0A3Q2PJZ6_FUNHE